MLWQIWENTFRLGHVAFLCLVQRRNSCNKWDFNHPHTGQDCKFLWSPCLWQILTYVGHSQAVKNLDGGLIWNRPENDRHPTLKSTYKSVFFSKLVFLRWMDRFLYSIITYAWIRYPNFLLSNRACSWWKWSLKKLRVTGYPCGPP